MKFSAAEIVQIIIGLLQLYFGFLALRRQSEAPQKSNAPAKGSGRYTFWNTIEAFDVFALLVSLGCLVLAATLSLPSLLDWAERLARFALLGMGSAIFTLTIIRVQATKFTLQMTHAFENAVVDGGEF